MIDSLYEQLIQQKTNPIQGLLGSLEFEYTLLNHDLTIDQIRNRSRRKSVISLDLKQAEIIAPVSSSSLARYNPDKTIDCSTKDKNTTPYAIQIPLEGENTRILISPDQTMLKKMKEFLPRTLEL